MKKVFAFVAVALTAMTASAGYTLNNPVGDDGRYIVKYDCASNNFAAANDMQFDETFTFAVDITGTWLEDFVNGQPGKPNASRGIAINKWTSMGDVDGETNRLKQINGNIWGMTVNYKQIATGDFSHAAMKDSILYVDGQIFGFEYTADDPGADWWMWGGNPVDVTAAPGAPDAHLFAFKAFVADANAAEFYGDDFTEKIYGYDRKGYAAPCVMEATDLREARKEAAEGRIIMKNGIMYIMDHAGAMHSMLGF